MQLMPDSPIRRAALEVEAHVATDGWDQSARLFALVTTTDLLAAEPQLAESLGVDSSAEPDALTSIEQELPADGRELEDVLTEIGWPDSVIGCAVVVERVMLPPEAEESLPDDPDEMIAAAAVHPDRSEVRLVAAATRGGAVHSAVRARVPDDGELLEGPELVPGLIAQLQQTLEP